MTAIINTYTKKRQFVIIKQIVNKYLMKIELLSKSIKIGYKDILIFETIYTENIKEKNIFKEFTHPQLLRKIYQNINNHYTKIYLTKKNAQKYIDYKLLSKEKINKYKIYQIIEI